MLSDYQNRQIQKTLKTMKNFKTHKKLNPFKCPNFYRTNCNLIDFIYIILILTTFVDCSEVSLRSNKDFSRNYLNSEVTPNLSTYKSDSSSRKISGAADGEDSARLIALKNSTLFSSQQLVERLQEEAFGSRRRKPGPHKFHRLQKIILQGLGLQSLPDGAKMNVSQQEYLSKYREYLDLVRERKRRELSEFFNGELKDYESVVAPTISTYSQNITEIRQYSRSRRRRSTFPGNVVYMRFPLKVDPMNLSSEANNQNQNDVDEANLRLLLVTKNHNAASLGRNHFRHGDWEKELLTLKVYQLIEPYGRVWLDSKEVDLGSANGSTSSRWLEFDVTKAVRGWVSGQQANLGLEIHCDNCHSHGSHIVEDLSINTDPDSNPVLNIIGTYGTHREKRSRQHHHFMQNGRRKPRKTDCYKENQKCCRHTMEVVFKEIKGFEFIIQPKVFDAGYCRGKCPPRYNPAHHHAFLQSLIWKQDRSKAPRPCCAPSKLVELEVLHVDENDNKKLKVSTWSDMRVLECACS